jgi:hypothetical protein
MEGRKLRLQRVMVLIGIVKTVKYFAVRRAGVQQASASRYEIADQNTRRQWGSIKPSFLVDLYIVLGSPTKNQWL